MYKKYFYPGKTACEELSRQLFIEQSGVGKEGRKFERMKDRAFKIREVIEDKIDIRSLYMYYDEFKLAGNTLSVNSIEFKCAAFEQVNPDVVEGVFFYAASAGDFELEKAPVMDMVYADIWGNAFADATRQLMKEEIAQKYKLSDSFGPGFYGMDVSYMKSMAQVIDFNELNMKLHRDRILLPLKSCAGIYFNVNDKYTELNNECRFCMGNHTSCKLCRYYKGV